MNTSFNTIIFDVDSTLSTIEGIDELARMKGFYKQFSPLTKMAMEGKIKLEEAFVKRLEIIRPTREDLKRLSELYIQNITPHAKETVNNLVSQNKELYIISGGYKEAILPLAEVLGIKPENVNANEIYFDEKGNYTGFNENIPLWKQYGKKTLLQTLDLKPKTVLIGDGVSDLETKEVVDLFVGYGGVKVREIVKQNSSFFLTDLQELSSIIDTI